MKKKRLLALLVSAVVLVTMSFGMTATAFAGETAGSAIEKAPVGQLPVLQSDNLLDKAVKLGNSGTRASVTSLPSVPARDGYAVFDKSVTQFTVTVPATGYLVIGMRGYTSSSADYGVNFRTKGFTANEYLYSGNEYTTLIGVKKGTYTFTTSTYGDYYIVATAFKTFKESKYGKKKSKAKKIKKKKYQKGLMITGAQKTHWYKFKNTKKHKVAITFITALQDTGKLGGIKVTVYKGKKSFGTRTIFTSNNKMKTIYKPYNTWGMKLTKGTYYIKVQPYNKATGYFKMKWK